MHRPDTITIKEMNDTLKEMKTIYAYNPTTTWFGDIRDDRCNNFRRVEIHTVDEKTGVDIVLSKRVPVTEDFV